VDKFLLNLFFPKFCLGCQKEGTYLCDDCRHLLDICEYNYCLCDKPTKIFGNLENGKCQKCNSKNLDGLYFALAYKNKLAKKIICQFKYKPYLKDLSKTLASILIEYFIKTNKNTDKIWKNSVLIPVPIHAKKFRERGYNQSEELAKELAKIIKIPVISNFLIKTKNTNSQAELSKIEREKNLFGAFAINQNFEKNGFTHFSKIFLVDDVYTTGCTMQECAKTLRKAGFKNIWGLTLAREE
jgi:ComF family protein